MAKDIPETRQRRQARYTRYHKLYYQVYGPWCSYCGNPPTGLDHIWPLSACHITLPSHMLYTVPACNRCNSIGSKHQFICFDFKQDYITRVRQRENFPPFVDLAAVTDMYRIIYKTLRARGHSCDVPERYINTGLFPNEFKTEDL